MHKIIFKTSGSEDSNIFAALGEKILDVAKKANVAIDAPCSGNVSCGKCKVKIIKGEVKSEITRHITQEEWDAGYRLACNSFVAGDVTVEVPDIAHAYKSRMKIADLSSEKEVAIFNTTKKQVQDAGIAFENDMKPYRLKMNAPTPEDAMNDSERVLRALSDASGNENTALTYSALLKLPDALRENNFDIYAITQPSGGALTITDVVSAKTQPAIHALAVDIGTTTVSALLVDMLTGSILAKASTGNGQIRFGADVINRIIEQTKEGGAAKLQNAVISETINPLIETMCSAADIKPCDILRMYVASNTTMNHLFAGVSANYLRQEPFVPVFFDNKTMKGKDLSLKINADAEVRIAPNIGSYVGGDITAGTLSSMIWNKAEYSLFIDLGTNGEIVFGNRDFMMSCACSAGPAFEGGDISCGMRASDGAVEAVKIDKDTMEPTYEIIGDGNPVGICGSGIIDIIAELYKCGIINGKGKFVREGERVVKDEYGTASYVVARKEEAHTVKDILLSEVDIDNFIRAKAAIFSAVNVMLEMLELDVSVIENVYVAGGIGSGIDMGNAVMIGMFPDIPIEKFNYIGNSALTGCYMMLTSADAEQKVQTLAKNMTYVELSSVNKYMDEFIAACFIPHTDETLFPTVKA